MVKPQELFCALVLPLAAALCQGAGQQGDDLCEFAKPRHAADAGWCAEASAKGSAQPALHVSSDAKVGRYALEAQGAKGQGLYGGLRFTRRADLSACGPQDKVCFWVKQNAASGIYANFGFEEGKNCYRTVSVPNGRWTYVELDMDPKNWLGGRSAWGTMARVAFYTRTFDAPGEHMLLDGLHIRLASGKALEGFRKPEDPGLSSWTFPQQTEKHWILGNKNVAFAIAKRTGRVEGGWNVAARQRYLDALEAVYFVESKSFKKRGDGANDQVERVVAATPSRVKVQCRNAGLPQVSIVKQYDVAADDNKLVRTVTLLNEGAATDWYATPSSRAFLRRSFRDGGFYMGSGYVGPLVPAPEVAAPVRVGRYRISPKGMLLVNRERGHTLAHYRHRVAGHFLFPWISKYVESENVLYYTPSGWQFGLATVALLPGKPASIEEHVMILPGTHHDFLTRDYPKLPAVAARINQLAPRPEWRENIKVYIGTGCDEHIVPTVQQAVELTDEGDILILMNLMGPWTDYPTKGEMPGPFGGKIDGASIRKLVAKLHALSPRVKVSIYTWIISGTWNARPYLQHPDWFRPLNKAGNFVNFFPGCAANYATLVNRPACRDFLLRQYADHLRDWNLDAIYLDGAKTTNVIDWQQNTLTQDADWEDFWLAMRQVCRAAGPDKALFYNGRASLYADISFIEARSEMREANWRDYAGLMTCTKSFVANDPGFVVIPLYWIDRLAVPYVNHFIPLGYRPALGHGSKEVLKRMPFVTAGFELKDVRLVEVGLKPNWQEDADTALESYAMRQGSAVVLGLIGHYGKPVGETVSVDAEACGFARDRVVYAWEFDLANPQELQGRASERDVKEVYQRSGWFLDRTTSVRCAATSVDAAGRVALPLRFDGPMLKVLALTQTPGAVWSVDGRPVHFNLPATSGVALTRKDDLCVEVNCTRARCEVLVPLAGPAWSGHVLLDGKKVSSSAVAVGGGCFAEVPIARGRHEVRWEWRDAATRPSPAAIRCPARVMPGQDLAVEIRSSSPVALTASLSRRPVFARSVDPSAGPTVLSVPKALASGTLVLAAHSPGCEPALAKVAVGEADYAPATQAVFPQAPPPERKVWDVGRTVRGVNVLRAATERWHSGLATAHVASVDPDQLRFEAGSSDWLTSFMGGACAGIEAEGLRVVTLRVQNTFHREFNLRATRYHLHPYKPSSRVFAGLMVDYHSQQGYAKRVALSLGLLDMKRGAKSPEWGSKRRPDQFVELRKLIDEGNDAEITLDLARYAPKAWDGRVWFTVGVEWVAPGRRLLVTVLENRDKATGPVTVGTDFADLKKSFKRPRRVEVPRATFVPVVDGVMDEEAWREAAEIREFVLLDEAGLPSVWTRARLFYDAERLYVGVQCQEPDRTAPLVGNEGIWRDDEVELCFDVDGDPATRHQLIVNARGDSLGLLSVGPWDHKAKCAGQSQKGVWTVEVALPFASLGVQPKVGATWRFNIARHRPASARTNAELITWSVVHATFNAAAEFGALTLRGTAGK